MLQITVQQAKVLKIASSDDSRPVLTGVEIKPVETDNGRRVSVTATDSYHLLQIIGQPLIDGVEPAEIKNFKPQIITRKQIERAVQIAKIDKEKTATIKPAGEDEIIQGSYPEWEKLKPAADRPAGRAKVNRRYLIELLQAMEAETVLLDVAISEREDGISLDPVIITGEDWQQSHQYYGILMPLRS